MSTDTVTQSRSDDDNRRSYEKVVRLHHAVHIRKGRIQKSDIERLLQTEGDINYQITEGSKKVPNLLCTASRYIIPLHFDLLSLLLDCSADFTCKDNKGQTAVHNLIEKRTPSSEQDLDPQINSILAAHVKFNNPSNPCDKNGISHFHAACITNNVEAVDFFLKNGIDVNQSVNVDSPYFPSYTPLYFAVKYVYPNIVEILLNYGANIHLKNADILSPLHMIMKKAIKKYESTDEIDKILDIVRKFVNYSEIDTDGFGFRKFHLACLLSDESLVESELEQVTDINQPINFDSPVCTGFTALHFAAFSNARIFNLLLNNGANIEAKNSKEQTPLDLCLQNFSIDDILLVFSSKKEWKNFIMSDNKSKVLDVILAMEDLDKFTSFLDRNELAITISVPNDSPLWPGYTLLHLAVTFSKNDSSSTEIVVECLKRGADITKADVKGSTALHLAFYIRKPKIVDYLLDQHEKSVNPVDKDNLSHFHIACAAGHSKAVKLFLSANVNVNSSVNSKFSYSTDASFNVSGPRHYPIYPGSTALHINIASGNFDMTEQLLKHGADVNAQDVNGFTPIHRLLNWGNEERWIRPANLLLKNKRLKNIVTNSDLSHLHVACYFYHREAVEKLLKIGADPKETVVDMMDKRIKDYDEFLCDSLGNYGMRLPYLSDYAGFTSLDFLWHSHRSVDQSGCKTFWTIGSTLLARSADIFADKDKRIPILRRLLQKIDGYKCFHAKWQENVTTTVLEDEFGVTTLHIACHFVDVKLVEDSINQGANVNAKVNFKSPVWQGFTPLHIIVKTSFSRNVNKSIMDKITKIARLLIKHGANPLLVDDDNNTPLHEINKVCRNNGYVSEITRQFTFFANIIGNIKKFDVNPENNDRISVFHLACIAQKKIVVEEFLKHGVDVNQSVSDFSDRYSGMTALIIVIDYYGGWDHPLSYYGSDNETFLGIIDLLLKYKVNVNATDAFGETALFKAAKSNMLRRVLIEKLISNGADLHPINMYGNTALEFLIRRGDVSSEEIELFVKSGCHWNEYNSVTAEGYMAQFFRFQQRDTLGSNNIMDNPIFVSILNNSKTVEIHNNGRTAIHNVVSINYHYIDADESEGRYRSQKLYFWRSPEVKAKNRWYHRPKTTYKDYYMDLIEQLCKRGCDIDHEDNEGRTALHLATIFKNDRSLVPLLKNGADINITDQNGKTAFAYCGKATEREIDPWGIEELDVDYNYGHRNYAIAIFALHVHKLEFCGQHVNNQNKRLKNEALEIVDLITGKALDCFQAEVEMSKNINIGTTTLSLYEFFMNTDIEMLYMDMTNEDRLEFDQFFEHIAKYHFSEIDCLLKLKYRQSIERPKLIEPAMASLNLLVNCVLPDVCCRMIFKCLKNADLKKLIDATTL